MFVAQRRLHNADDVMKRSWFSIVMVGAVIGLLTLFLGLQYKSLSEISNAERERMQRRVETDADRFAEDFDREMQAAYYNFQTPADVWKNSACLGPNST